jgi:DNA-binding NarL/FixJ family response regulator
MTYLGSGRESLDRRCRPPDTAAVEHQTPITHPAPRPLRLVVVESDRRVRQSLCSFMELGAPIKVVGSAGDAATALELIASERPDVVLLDPRLPDLDAGLAMLATARAAWPDLRVLLMGGADTLDNPQLAEATGRLARNADPNDFVRAVLAAGGASA